MIIGAIVIILGVLLLLQNLGVITYNLWGLFLPLVLILLGLKIAMRKGGHHHWGCCCKSEDKKEEKPQQ